MISINCKFISCMHFSVHTSLGIFVLTICNYLLLLLLCGIVHINSKLRLVGATENLLARAIPVKSLQRLGPSLNPGLVCS